MIADLLALPGVRRHQISCRACNRLGVVVDVAHATEDTVKRAAKVASKPLLLSHSAPRGSRAQGETPLVERQITPDHARAVADTGGSIGIWHFFATPELYVKGLKEMVEVVGVDHVSIGIGGNYLRIFAASVR